MVCLLQMRKEKRGQKLGDVAAVVLVLVQHADGTSKQLIHCGNGRAKEFLKATTFNRRRHFFPTFFVSFFEANQKHSSEIRFVCAKIFLFVVCFAIHNKKKKVRTKKIYVLLLALAHHNFSRWCALRSPHEEAAVSNEKVQKTFVVVRHERSEISPDDAVPHSAVFSVKLSFDELRNGLLLRDAHRLESVRCAIDAILLDVGVHRRDFNHSLGSCHIFFKKFFV